MQGFKKNKLLMYLFVLTLLVFVVYFFFLRGGASSSDTTSSLQTNTAGQNLLSGLEQLSTAQIDTALFNSSAWQSLHNISTPVPTNAPGNQTLFAPAPSQ